jgi:hypothetical protein
MSPPAFSLTTTIDALNWSALVQRHSRQWRVTERWKSDVLDDAHTCFQVVIVDLKIFSRSSVRELRPTLTVEMVSLSSDLFAFLPSPLHMMTYSLPVLHDHAEE